MRLLQGAPSYLPPSAGWKALSKMRREGGHVSIVFTRRDLEVLIGLQMYDDTCRTAKAEKTSEMSSLERTFLRGTAIPEGTHVQ